MRRKKTNEKMNLTQVGGEKPSNLDMQKIEKDFMEIIYRQKKQRNNLLGTFVGGQYKLDDETILQKLIEIPKKVEETDKNVVYLSQKLNDFYVLNFKIELDISESYCTAKLFFFETENSFQENEKYTTLLDEQVAPYSPSFVQDMLKLWHAYYNEDPFEIDDYILSYLEIQRKDFEFVREINDILSQLYILRMLKLLEGLGEDGKKLQAAFNLEIEKISLKNPDIHNNFTLQKVILDKVLQKNKGFVVVLKTEEGKQILNDYYTPLKNIQDKTIPAAVEPVKEEKQKQPQKAKDEKKSQKAKSKAAAKSSSKPFVYDSSKIFGGGSKKKEEKKDKKDEPKLFPTQNKKEPEKPQQQTIDKKQVEPKKEESFEELQKMLLKNISISGGVVDVIESANEKEKKQSLDKIVNKDEMFKTF